MRILLTLTLLASVILAGCNGSGPVFDPTPEISLVSITPDRVTHGSVDSLKITIHFQDGDGDLGAIEGSAPGPNLWVVDQREGVVDTVGTFSYTIPNLSPDTKNPSIQGTIEVTMDAPILRKYFVPPFTQPSEEEVSFQIYLVDRAGNMSNTILTPPITIYE